MASGRFQVGGMIIMRSGLFAATLSARAIGVNWNRGWPFLKPASRRASAFAPARFNHCSLSMLERIALADDLGGQSTAFEDHRPGFLDGANHDAFSGKAGRVILRVRQRHQFR